MRTETRKYEVYKVDELSDKAKENAYWKWLKALNMTHPTTGQR